MSEGVKAKPNHGDAFGQQSLTRRQGLQHKQTTATYIHHLKVAEQIFVCGYSASGISNNMACRSLELHTMQRDNSESAYREVQVVGDAPPTDAIESQYGSQERDETAKPARANM